MSADSSTVESKRTFSPKQVVEEESQGDQYAHFATMAKKELFDKSQVQGMANSIFKIDPPKSPKLQRVSSEHLFHIGRESARFIIRIIIFAVLVAILLVWNARLIELGDQIKVNYQDEKCSVINRFDYSDNSWLEELKKLQQNNVNIQLKNEETCNIGGQGQ